MSGKVTLIGGFGDIKGRREAYSVQPTISVWRQALRNDSRACQKSTRSWAAPFTRQTPTASYLNPQSKRRISSFGALRLFRTVKPRAWSLALDGIHAIVAPILLRIKLAKGGLTPIKMW